MSSTMCLPLQHPKHQQPRFRTPVKAQCSVCWPQERGAHVEAQPVDLHSQQDATNYYAWGSRASSAVPGQRRRPQHGMRPFFLHCLLLLQRAPHPTPHKTSKV